MSASHWIVCRPLELPRHLGRLPGWEKKPGSVHLGGGVWLIAVGRRRELDVTPANLPLADAKGTVNSV